MSENRPRRPDERFERSAGHERPVGHERAVNDRPGADVGAAMLDALALPVAERVCELLAERLEGLWGRLDEHRERSPWLNVAEAAEYLRCKPKRIYDLVSQRRLPCHRDGARSLFQRAELDAYVAGTPLAPVSHSALQSGSQGDERIVVPRVARVA